MPFEQANVIARFYYDYQDTNALIDEAERLATEDAGRLRTLALSLKDETATLLDNIGKRLRTCNRVTILPSTIASCTIWI